MEILFQSLTSVSTQLHRGLASYHRHYSRIEIESSYAVNISFYISPTLASGMYNLSVHTDYRNQVFELNSDDNNLRWTLITIRQRFPDLAISNFTCNVEPTIRGNVLRCSYTVENVGTGITIGAPWFDQLSISPFSVDNIGRTTLSNTRHLSELPVGERYNENIVLSLQPRVFGTMYLTLMIDSRNQVAEENKMNNRIQSAPTNILPLFPDFAVQALNISVLNLQGGQDIELMWSVINRGEVIVESPRWHDSVFLNSSQSLDKLADTIVYNGANNMLAPGMTYHQRLSVTLPLVLDYSLPYNILLRVNSRGSVVENNRPDNNYQSIAVAISPPPSPDLQVTRVSYTYFPPSRVLAVQWTVHNTGNSMGTTMSWRDQAFLSSTQSYFNPAESLILGHRDQSLRMLAGQVYTLRDSFFVPSTVSGDFYVYIMTDVASTVMEIGGEENNFLRSNNTLTVAQVPTVTLNVTLNTAGLLASYSTGQSFRFEYSVMNSGEVALGASSWVDGIYLSAIANPSRSYLLNDAFLLTQNVISMQLDQNDTYTVVLNVTLPYQITGQQFLAVLLDMNNVLDIRTTGTFGTIISIVRGSLPDLTVTAISRNSNITSGQPTTVNYTVRNEGEAAATGLWYEALVLSLDAQIDPFDTRLRTVSHPRNDVLRVNESYNQSVEVFVPYDLPTSYYYIFITVDNRNDIYEERVDNNEDHLVVFVTETVSTDLAILDVQISPVSVNYSDPINFRWRLRNNGTLQARGYKCDSIYLSEDDMWDISDYEIDLPQCSHIALNGFNNNLRNDMVYSHPAIAPFIAQQDYYGLVRTRTNIRDPNLDNNIGSSSTLIEINAPSITLGQLTTISLQPNDVRVYRIQGVPADETLVATLVTTEQQNVYHDLYLRHRQAPTGAEHDAFSQFALSSSQRAVLRYSRNGVYYLRIESFTNSDVRSEYNVEILVKIAQFEILGIAPTTAAPLGNVTIKVTGTVLSYHSSASLVSSSVSIQYQSSKIYWFTSGLVYATFDLTDAEFGTYTILLTDEKTGNRAQLNDSFTIGMGTPGQLSINVQPPRRLRVGESGDILIQILNIGNTDLLTPHLVLVSRDETLFRLVDDYAPIGFSEQIDFLGLPLEGPGGILPPGTSTQVTFKAAQSEPGPNQARFRIKSENNASAPHAYLNRKSSLRPNFILPEVWDTIWENFIKSVGTTQQSFQQRLSEIATEFSLVGKRAYSVQELAQYQLDIAYGLLSGIVLVVVWREIR